MKPNRLIILITLLIFGLSLQTALADDLDDLDSLSDSMTSDQQGSSNSDLEELDAADFDELDMDSEQVEEMESSDDASGLKVNFGGYLKMLSYWNQEKYSDLLWNMFQSYPTQPPAQDLSGFNNVGTRLQLKIEGYLGEHARLFSAFNINYNIAGSIHDTTTTTTDGQKQNADLRMVESFVEVYEGSRIWKVGPQLVTWSYLEGMEVPTDRVNARDNSYKSTEYEDSKLPSTGVLLTQNISSSQFEVMMIPIARTNIGMEFQNYLYPGAEDSPKRKPNQTKWATRFSSTVGKLDYAISYVEGIDPNADLHVAAIVGGQPVFGRAYNRIKSPGLDLQYNLGSLLAKLSYVNTMTEDEDGDSLLIKNSWNKYVIGSEFSVGGSTVNIYAGQHTIQDFKIDAFSQQTNFLLGQIRERTDFISGHINANFLTGDALNMVLMAANYWDEEGESVQTIVRGTFKYKIADGLDLLFTPSYMDMLDNQFTDIQTEIKYSF
ncbi:MAG: hypothetical protein HOK67_02560 [Deltaproteobacteria bacterium]|jgi:hypothetical protein|nr:hypothetical protein [Deltaproteobacteria bacterium]MBT4262725.1 hypothetical protein [Deltaproteobacteria bacterium]MBT4640900.1 hypothetical protein [Deltaproteobacteria bacterium]MBT6498770.1 hypothetical protein [Deltaproteobacteria bacterium]MBT6616233.1 hypothetical protein [Deltaproteobacteria bacterium]